MGKPVLFCDDGSEVQLPYKWVICSACCGEGKSSAYLGAFSRSDLDEAGPEFFEDYMAGLYDLPCEACAGNGKVEVADMAKMSKAQKAEYRAQKQDDREYAAMVAAERRMGC